MVSVGQPVASRDLRKNQRLRSGDLRFDGSVPTSEVTASESDLLNQYLRVDKKQNERIESGDVSKGPTLDLAGKQVLSIPITATRALGAMLDPGMVVDVRGKSTSGTEATAFCFPKLVVEAVLDGAADATGNSQITLIVSFPKDANGAEAPMPSLDLLLNVSDLMLVAYGA